MTGTTLTDRALLRISGEEARSFLQGLLTRDVLTLKADEPRWTGLLTPQGHTPLYLAGLVILLGLLLAPTLLRPTRS